MTKQPSRGPSRKAGAQHSGGGRRPGKGKRSNSSAVADRAAGTAARTETARHAKSGPSGPVEPMRIAKAIARAGLCSRRDAERWIADGRVAVNGRTIDSPARDVGPGDAVTVDNAPLPTAEPVKLWRYHKPRGQVTSHRDPEGRPTVFDNLPKHLPRVISVGRLDFNTEGLLLLTTDGDLARHLELPSTGWLRRYRVRAFGQVSQDALDGLSEGIEIDGVRYGPIEAVLDGTSGNNVWMTIGLREGKNREVRRILESLSLTVNRLIRLSYGPFQLGDLAVGEAEIVRRRVLAEQLGHDLAEKFRLRDGDDAGAHRREQRRREEPGKPTGAGSNRQKTLKESDRGVRKRKRNPSRAPDDRPEPAAREGLGRDRRKRRPDRRLDR